MKNQEHEQIMIFLYLADGAFFYVITTTNCYLYIFIRNYLNKYFQITQY